MAVLGTVAFVVLSPNVRAKAVYAAWLVVALVLQLGVRGPAPAAIGLVLEALLGVVLVLHHRYNRWA